MQMRSTSWLLVLAILLAEAGICCSQALHDGSSGSGGGKKKDQRLRHRKRNKQGGGGGKANASGKNKNKLKLSQAIDTASNSYGTTLPAFAFDYSEYLSSAVIERSSMSDNLYLSMFFVGHRSIGSCLYGDD